MSTFEITLDDVFTFAAVVRDEGRMDVYDAVVAFAQTLSRHQAYGVPLTAEDAEEFAILRRKYHITQMNMRATLVPNTQQTSVVSAFKSEYYGNRK